MLLGRETCHLHLLVPLLLTGGKGVDLVIRGNIVLNNLHGFFAIFPDLMEGGCGFETSLPRGFLLFSRFNGGRSWVRNLTPARFFAIFLDLIGQLGHVNGPGRHGYQADMPCLGRDCRCLEFDCTPRVTPYGAFG
jgi:hypothetical protein